MQERQSWYAEVQEGLKPEEEEAYFEDVNRMMFKLHALEIRLARHRDLSALRFQALKSYLMADARLSGTTVAKKKGDVFYSML